MKNLVLLLSCITICIISFGQAKQTTKTKVEKSDSTAKPVAVKSETTYLMILSETDARRLWEFMYNADDYTEKGRRKFIEEYQRKTYVAPPDSASAPKISK